MTTTISSASTAAVTTQGIGSGLDIASLVDKLVTADSGPLTRLQKKETAYQTKVSAFGAARGALASFQSSVSTLANPASFASFSAKIGNDSLASVAIDTTASSSLSAGTHTLRVDQLAAAQRIASSAVATTSTTIGTGSLTIAIGSWNTGHTAFTANADAGSRTITIDSSNNTLAGIRDAINNADAGVSAAIINDGTGNRLVLSGTKTGAANGFRITTADDDGTNLDATGLSALAYEPTAPGGTPQTQGLADALNASFSIDGLAISKPDNHVTDVIAGLTLDLKQVDTTATTFTIARDTSNAKKIISSFVTSYNNIVANLGSLTSYDASTKSAGILNGDSSIRLISARLQQIVASVLPGNGSATTLGDIGIKFNSSGKLDIDDAKLTSSLTASPDAVARLFAKTGTSTDALVSYQGATDKTTVGTHALAVTGLASHGTLSGSSASGLTITAGVNDTFAITIDNVASTITLAAGTYASAAALATEVQSKINGTSAFSTAGSSVAVAESGGTLTITSQRFGSGSTVALGGGNGAIGLFGGAPSGVSGADVSGTLDGIAFLGTGQTATGATATDADGLKLTITGGSIGSRGTVSFNRGIAASLGDALTQFLDKDNGLITAATDSLNANIKSVQKSEDDWNTRLVAIRARYTKQFNAMDALVASLNSTSTYLTQQLEALKNSTKNS